MRPVIALFFALVLIFPAIGQAQGVISVRGEGRVEVIPDMATVTLGVVHQGKTAKAAMDLVSRDSRKIADKIRAAGVESRDVQTVGLTLNQVYDRSGSSNQPPKIIGFSASNRILVRIRDLSEIGQLLDTLLDAGANTFQGIQFGVSDNTAALNKARELSVQDARNKAQLYAQAAGVELGQLLELTENTSFSEPSPMIRAESFRADSMPISAGSQEVLVQIWIKYSAESEQK